MGLVQLGQAMDLEAVRQTAEGLARLQEFTEKMAIGRQRLAAVAAMGKMIERGAADEMLRRVCKTVLVAPTPPPAGSSDPPGPRQEDACTLLRQVLAAGPRPAAEVVQIARQRGVALITLRRARRRAGVLTFRRGFGPKACYLWKLPQTANSRKEGP